MTALPRTYLYAPADRPDRFAKALASGADAVIVDLEDGVAPAAKDAGVRHAAELLAGRPAVPCWVRLDGERWAADLPALMGPGLAGVVVPKAETRARLEAVAALLDELEAAAGLAPGSVPVTPLLESPAGIAALAELAAAPRVLRFGMGEADLAAALLVRPRADGLHLLHVRSQVVLASAVAGIAPPIASTSTDFRDLGALAASTALLRDLGFTARTTVHPAQVPVVRDALSPTPAERERALAVVAAWDAAAGAANGVSAVSGTLVDLAVVRAARALLATGGTDGE